MRSNSVWRQIIFATTAILVTAGICFPFADTIGYRSVALILLSVLSVLAMRQSLPAVLTAAVTSALVWDFFFIPPHFTFHIDSTEDGLFMTMYFIVAIMSGIINHRMRQMEALKREKIATERSIGLYNTLFSSLSHDLRTPIAAVLGAADTLREHDKQLTPAQKQKLQDEISNGAIRLSEQVENLLNMSRIEAGMIKAQKAWCDVRDLIHSAIKKSDAVSMADRIHIQIPDTFPLVQLDFGLTEHILFNLFNNALRHTPPDTTVEVRAQIRHVQSGHFDAASEMLSMVKDNDRYALVLEVSDNGPGLPAHEIEKVFDKFYRLGDTQTSGTGLGLYVAKGLTEAQGGEISLRNRTDHGACFTLEFITPIMQQTIRDHA